MMYPIYRHLRTRIGGKICTPDMIYVRKHDDAPDFWAEYLHVSVNDIPFRDVRKLNAFLANVDRNVINRERQTIITINVTRVPGGPYRVYVMWATSIKNITYMREVEEFREPLFLLPGRKGCGVRKRYVNITSSMLKKCSAIEGNKVIERRSLRIC